MDFYLGEIRIFAGNYVPDGWHLCDGTGLSTGSYAELFSIIGYQYGGSGGTFNLPNFTQRVIVGTGTNYPVGAKGGYQYVTLSEANMPPHTHAFNASLNDATTGDPTNAYLAVTNGNTANGYPNVMLYINKTTGNAVMDTTAIQTVGGAPHSNMMPSLTLNYIMCIKGLYPQPGQ